MLKMIPVPIPNTWLFWLLLLASFFFGIPASEAAFLKNMPSGAKNYFPTDLSPDKSPKHQDSCWVPRQNPRDSSSVLTVFIQEDPRRDGMHWYGYVNGDPINYVDPAGFEGFSTGVKSYLFDDVVPGIQAAVSPQTYLGLAQRFSSLDSVKQLIFDEVIPGVVQELDDTNTMIFGGLANILSDEGQGHFTRGLLRVAAPFAGGKLASSAFNCTRGAKVVNTDPLISVYHGSHDNYTQIMKSGFDPNRTPVFVSRDRMAAENAIHGRYEPPTDFGVVEAKILQSDFDKLLKEYERPYPGFHGANLQSTEIRLTDAERISIFNKGIQK